MIIYSLNRTIDKKSCLDYNYNDSFQGGEKMKILKALLLAALVFALCCCVGCSGGSGGSSGYDSQYDRDAEVVADAFGVDSDKVKDSVGALGEAMR